MSRKVPSRREFLTLPLAVLLAPFLGRPVAAAADARKAKYGADVSILYGVLTYRLEGNTDGMGEAAPGPRASTRSRSPGKGTGSPTGSSLAAPSGRGAGRRSRPVPSSR